MLFEHLTTIIASTSGKKALDSLIAGLNNFLINENALAYAKESLRDKYEQAVLPASYEHVVENLRLTRSDFISYFRNYTGATTLRGHLSETLQRRSESWMYNIPDRTTLEALVGDFLSAYERYFTSVDQHITALRTLELSGNTLDIVSEIRSFLLERGNHYDAAITDPAHTYINKEIKSFLTILNVPFEIVDESKNSIELIVIDPSSIFSNRFYLCAVTSLSDVSYFDDLVLRARRHSHLSNIFFVTFEPLTYEYVSYAEHRSIDVNSLSEFRQKFLKVSTQERYVVGRIATQALCEIMNVHEIYVEPDAVPAVPGDLMENLFYSTRKDSLTLIKEFLADGTTEILFLFGGYGAGKSALCARLMHVLQSDDFGYVPVYFALKQLKSADDLSKIVAKADQLAKALAQKDSRALIILDGLDELPNAMASDEKKQNMLRLLQCAARTDKIMVAVRTAYFRGMNDFWQLFGRANDGSLWADMARFIPEGGKRPKVAALLLREFDTDQIEAYVSAYANVRGLPSGFPDEFFDSLRKSDHAFNYMMLARNPLYLFLLVNSQPWKNPEAKCLADVFRIFIRYWLERDVEKGRSRWSLSIQDRVEFIKFVALYMFENYRHAITFKEFDELVVRYFEGVPSERERASLGLDLQTTGIFAATGNLVQFFIPGFLDYLVVWQFAFWRFSEGHEPSRLPTLDQVYLWAGLAKSGNMELNQPVHEWLNRAGVEYENSFSQALMLDPKGIIYFTMREGWNWPHLNSGQGRTVRIIINAVLHLAKRSKANQVPVCIVNRRGLHARACAKFVKFARGFLSMFPPEAAPEIKINKLGGDNAVSCNSIMGLMMLSAGPGSIILIEYLGCTEGDVEELIKSMGGMRQDELSGVWLLGFGEDEQGVSRQRVEEEVSRWIRVVPFGRETG